MYIISSQPFCKVQRIQRVEVGACGAVGIGTGTVLSSIPVGSCACGAEGRIALC